MSRTWNLFAKSLPNNWKHATPEFSKVLFSTAEDVKLSLLGNRSVYNGLINWFLMTKTQTNFIIKFTPKKVALILYFSNSNWTLDGGASGPETVHWKLPKSTCYRTRNGCVCWPEFSVIIAQPACRPSLVFPLLSSVLCGGVCVCVCVCVCVYKAAVASLSSKRVCQTFGRSFRLESDSHHIIRSHSIAFFPLVNLFRRWNYFRKWIFPSNVAIGVHVFPCFICLDLKSMKRLLVLLISFSSLISIRFDQFNQLISFAVVSVVIVVVFFHPLFASFPRRPSHNLYLPLAQVLTDSFTGAKLICSVHFSHLLWIPFQANRISCHLWKAESNLCSIHCLSTIFIQSPGIVRQYLTHRFCSVCVIKPIVFNRLNSTKSNFLTILIYLIAVRRKFFSKVCLQNWILKTQTNKATQFEVNSIKRPFFSPLAIISSDVLRTKNAVFAKPST